MLVTAYVVWGKAVHVADKYGVDTAAVAEAFAAATHVTADKLAGSGQERAGKEIREVRNYLFAIMYMIFGIVGNQGSSQTDDVDMGDWVEYRELSDKGLRKGLISDNPNPNRTQCKIPAKTPLTQTLSAGIHPLSCPATMRP